MDIPRNKVQQENFDRECAKRREIVSGAYPHKKWKARVMRMSDLQVIAVYMRLRSDGKI